MTWNWLRLIEAMTLPALAAALVAGPLWWRRKVFAGTMAGMMVCFVGFIVFSSLEFAEALRFRLWCQQTNSPCGPSHPSDFTRIVTFGFIAMTQVMCLFLASHAVERHLERRQYDSEWR